MAFRGWKCIVSSWSSDYSFELTVTDKVPRPALRLPAAQLSN